MTRDHGNKTTTPWSEETAKQPLVVGIHGAVEQHALATHALSEALRAAEDAGATAELIDLAELTLPPYHPDRTEPEDAAVFIHKVSEADAVVLATSVRHNSYSGLLKRALDYCDSTEFENKPVGLLAVAEESEPALALEHLRTVCNRLNTLVVPTQVFIDATWEDDELPEESVAALQKLGREVMDKR